MTHPPMKSKFLNCLPPIRWVPHDIPQSPLPSSPPAPPRKTLFPHRHRKPSHDPSHSSSLLPPPHRRKSTLSISSQPDSALDARTHAQHQSSFFARLPLELRRMVYEFVIGESAVVHLTLGSRARFGHFVCSAGERGEGGECGCRVLVGGRKGLEMGGWWMGVLGVCRRMYTEAIPHLYAPHTFSLLHVTHLLYLPTRLPSARLNSIRTLRLRWAIRALPFLRRGPSRKYAYPEDTVNWQRGWQILARMKGLRDLRVVLVDPTPGRTWEARWLDLEEQLLEPVKEVVGPRWFEVVLPYASCETDWDMGESRVVLRVPVEDGDEE
ncbi:hypothetical protein EJ04DRAFT_479405 [Polyplosphaeria fusca]|uniref:DUF7730 domain-containing protein n=1 Tax=Polyplosphaeria fusca TaxID=682080 RepID=A0A9P4QIR9_9PLEO|nr:hypothetical protein EJ04DRAFT_479405 [Polyplosphaeria fusca]